MDGPRGYHVNEAQLRKTNISLTHGTKKTRIYLQNRNRLTNTENKVMATKEEGDGIN